MAINIYDTITYSRNILMDDPVPELLQSRYFPTDPTFDTFQTEQVVLDYMDVDLKAGAFVKKGYVNGNTTQWRATQVDPPRIGISDTVTPSGLDRVAFEQLMYPQGDTQPTRADAINQLTRIKATRLVNRAQRRIESMIMNILLNNGLAGTIPTSPTDDTPVDVSISYAPDGGNDQRFAPSTAWGLSGSTVTGTPYKDVCAMIDALQAHGGSAEDLLLSPEAWQILRSDPEFKDRFSLPSNQYEGELFAKDVKDAKHVGIGDFGGFLLNIIVYYRKFVDLDGQTKPILPKGFVCVLRPNVGRTLCGGAVLINRAMIASEGIESSFVQRMGKFILSKSIDENENAISVRLESRPLPAPYAPWQWITMDAMNTNDLSAGSQGVYSNLDLYGVEGATYDSVALPIENWVRNAAKGGKVAFDTTKAALSGYTFGHIEDDDGNTLSIGGDGKFTNPGGTVGINVIFKSVITFNNNTGSGSMDSMSVDFGESGDLPACTFTKSSYTFSGWSTSASGEVEFLDEDEITPEGNVTLYAIWEAA